MTTPAIPPDAKVRVVGDVHGDATGFAYAIATDRFVVQLGDLPDHGPDSAATLRMMFDLVESGRGLFLLGNHDLKLARVLSGDHVRVEPVVQATIDQMDDALKERTLRLVARAPVWLRHGSHCSSTAGFIRICWSNRLRTITSIARTGRWRGRCTGSRPGGRSRTDTRSAVCVGSIVSPRA